jgi:hypothetical protein
MKARSAGLFNALFSLLGYFFTPLFLVSRNGGRPSCSDGGCCEKGAPSSGEKIVWC